MSSSGHGLEFDAHFAVRVTALVLAAICVVVALFVVVIPDVGASHADALNEAAELRSSTDALWNTLDVDSVRNVATSATKAGKRVAKLQNAYLDLLANPNEKKNAKTLSKLSKLFESDRESQRGRVQWIYVDAAKAKGARWSFKPTYSYATDSFSVAWVCTDTKTGHVLAYARAEYDIASGLFRDVRWASTIYGLEQAAGEGAAGVADADKAVLDMAERLDEQLDDYDTKSSKKNVENAKNAASELREVADGGE